VRRTLDEHCVVACNVRSL